jgi:hypothetical protein
MNQLKIVDLDFCESNLSRDRVEGGISVVSPTGSWSTAHGSAHNSGRYVKHSASRSGGFEYEVAGWASGAVAGAVSGATSDGTKYTSSYASASA